MPLPLHHGFQPPALTPTHIQPQPQYRNEHLMPPPFHPSRKPAPVTKAAAGKIDPDTSTPVTRLLATNHARKSSQAVDPFVTPFDDEHRVNARSNDPFSATSPPVTSNPFETPRAETHARESTQTNPFVAMAL